ncbi:ATP phosphoribosyltransferase regulatory subunit [Agaricicola taiwanensis]|uniref:ATP phosphoribosyltransferase regulatory subunit n=1 Tax=Agaricicola taiwanensis TaxID=591372 RepID=A0A8J2VNP0_9RHOB|nr:ATP phosphoribosyltransferase regulatory subunit [Agaricicola taiwanensis]GGE34161.1 ATP phosphoribosyltransferase regulatory subunit [Agaricicola taiwanensis]
MSSPLSNDALLARLEGTGYVRVEPPVLQPAGVFLDVSGEDLRRRMFLTSGPDGREMCLRPDLTIPTARLHLGSTRAGGDAAYCYLGSVFRFRSEASAEFTQAGIEIFGRPDREAADAEVIGCAADAILACGIDDPLVRIGDLALMGAVIEALGLPKAWVRRLMRDATRGGTVEETLDALIASREGAERAAFLAALDGSHPEAAKAVVEDLLAIAGISTVGGRSVSDIAERFLDQARQRAGADLSAEKRAALSRFLSIEGTLSSSIKELRALQRDTGLAMGATLDAFERRADLMSSRGLTSDRVTFAARFGRAVGYYTGFVFEFHSATSLALGPLVGGGRYDTLMTTLGAPQPVPAVGCAFWIERLQEAGR